MGTLRKKRTPKEFCPKGHSRLNNVNKDFGCKTCKQDRSRQEKYGITAEQYNELLSLQEGKCFICSCKPRSKSLAVDHDHKCCKTRKSCGKCIRGLLCMRCNHTLLGAAKEDPEILERAAQYLRNPPAKGVIKIICDPCGKKEHHFCDALLKSVPTLCDCQHREGKTTEEEVLAA